MVKFDEDDIGAVECILNKYEGIDIILKRIQKDAEELRQKVIDTENERTRIKVEEEDPLMERLHEKYGDFTLNDLLNMIQNDRK